tara:strand:- start:885 stop:1841 length:957 start_codon:yes stop_codon:yes gene_type:complete
MTLSHRLRVGAATGPFTFDDAAYSNFFTSNAEPIDISNSSVDTASSIDTHESIGAFFDHSASRIYIGRGSSNNIGPSYYTWNNGGSTYNNNATFYSPNGSSTEFAGVSDYMNDGVVLRNRGRNATVAYLKDNTPVIVVGHYSSRFYFFNYSNYNYIGRLDLSSANGGITSATNALQGVCFSGTHLIVGGRSGNNDQYVWGYDLPTNTSAIDGSTINHTLRWSPPSGSTTFYDGYGIAWGGGGRLYIGHYNNTRNAPLAYQYLLSDNGVNGTSTLVRSYAVTSSDDDINRQNYAVCIDYKNRELVLGGFTKDYYHVFGE